MGSDVQLTSYLQSSSAPEVPYIVGPYADWPQLPMSPPSAAPPPSSPAAPPSSPAAPPSSPTVPLHAAWSTLCTSVPQWVSAGPDAAAPGLAQLDVVGPPLLLLHATTSTTPTDAIAPRAIPNETMEERICRSDRESPPRPD